jgi:hypothetical protein
VTPAPQPDPLSDRSAASKDAFGIGNPDWPRLATEKLEAATEFVEHRLVHPANRVASLLVLGGVLAVFVPLLCILVIAGLVRLLNVYAFGGRDWASMALLGGMLSGGGMFFWSKRLRHKTEEAHES